MKTPCCEATRTLNRLAGTLEGSFASYLYQARPWAAEDAATAVEVLDIIALEQEKLALRISRVVQRRGVRPAPGRFPTVFTSCNDLALDDRLLRRVADLHLADLETIRACAESLGESHADRPLVDAVLRVAESHLDALEGLLAGEG